MLCTLQDVLFSATLTCSHRCERIAECREATLLGGGSALMGALEEMQLPLRVLLYMWLQLLHASVVDRCPARAPMRGLGTVA